MVGEAWQSSWQWEHSEQEKKQKTKPEIRLGYHPQRPTLECLICHPAPFSKGSIISPPPQTAPPSGDKVYKPRSLLGTFPIQTIARNKDGFLRQKGSCGCCVMDIRACLVWVAQILWPLSCYNICLLASTCSTHFHGSTAVLKEPVVLLFPQGNKVLWKTLIASITKVQICLVTTDCSITKINHGFL